MKIQFILGLTACLVALSVATPAQAKNCGKYRGTKLVTHKVTCTTAKKVYKRYDTGRSLPSGWTCAASAGICQRSNSRYFTFRLN